MNIFLCRTNFLILPSYFFYTIISSIICILFYLLNFTASLAQTIPIQNIQKDSANISLQRNQSQQQKVYPNVIYNAKRTIDIICSSKMEGRGYVNDGEELAASYIVEQFDKIGLLKYKSSYFQSFNLKSVNIFPKKNTIKIKNRHFCSR